MKKASLFYLVLPLLLALSLGGCGRPQTTLGKITLSGALGQNNEPQGTIEDVPASLPQVYLVGEVLNPSGSTLVTVRWYKGGEVLSTELFSGNRSDTNPYDFSSNPLVREKNFFASILKRPGEIWPVGDFRVEVYLGGGLVKTLNFRIIPESEAEIEARKKSVKRIFFGAELEGDLVGDIKTTFGQAVEQIYVVAELTEAPVGEKMRLVIEYLPQAKSLVTFVQDVEPGLSILTLKRSNLAPVLGTSFWKTGGYGASLYIDDILVQKASFRIQ